VHPFMRTAVWATCESTSSMGCLVLVMASMLDVFRLGPVGGAILAQRHLRVMQFAFPVSSDPAHGVLGLFALGLGEAVLVISS